MGEIQIPTPGSKLASAVCVCTCMYIYIYIFMHMKLTPWNPFAILAIEPVDNNPVLKIPVKNNFWPKKYSTCFLK